jgi:sarcosine oxidase
VAYHHGGPVTTADTVVRTVDEQERAAIRDVVRQWLPRLPGAIIESSVCLYTNTPDQDFVIDTHPADAAVLLASCCSGHGFKFAPALGELVADLVTGRTPAIDLSPFGLARFARA